ncbi:MAG: PHP domain-containing protein [Clostridiales bacterium]|nr:PHP domain-containing protein [Clostridiales bacterium]
MIANYHTHTRWCRHAEGEIEDYIREAIAKGLKAVAITDHVPHTANFDPRRMQWEEFPAFNAELDAMIAKYQDQIHIIKGFECEFYPFSMENYRMFREEYGYDLLILGHHTSKDRSVDNFAPKGERELKLYADEVIEGLHTGMFTFLAHPDVALCGYHETDDFALEQMGRIFACCQELNIPVEINANGYRDGRRYPDRRVWELSRNYRLTYLINSDAHFVPDLCDEAGVGGTEQFARELGISVTEWFDW